MKTLVCIMAIMVGVGCSTGDTGFEKSVRKAVVYQMERYPASHLKDLYKSFFQDRFGPGHIIKDASGARAYIEAELASYDTSTNEMVEPTGWEHNFYRVSLDAVKRGQVTVEQMTDALVRSANSVQPTTIEQWKAEWGRIEAVVRSMNLSLPDYDKELAEIDEALAKGIYMGHHSEAYSTAYDPHYRIISRQIYETELLPLLKND
jgi:hypothetical protein